MDLTLEQFSPISDHSLLNVQTWHRVLGLVSFVHLCRLISTLLLRALLLARVGIATLLVLLLVYE